MPALDSLVHHLEEHRLLLPAQQEELAKLARVLPDSSRLLKELVRRGWLTIYQAQRLAEGRGGELLVGPYLVLERLGSGGGGQVFKARHQKMQRIVALKVLRSELAADAEAVQRFYREIEVASQLSHPNIVLAYEAGPIGKLLFLAMEYVDGPDLGRLVRQSGPLPAPQACEYLRQAALGLHYASERGLVHRDIKPSNLLLTTIAKQVVVKILDLGLARLQEPVRGSQTNNLTLLAGNQVMQGTPDFMAPEQALDFHSADTRSDIYSLGCTGYFLLTGEPPFQAASLTEKLMKHQQTEAPLLTARRRDMPAELSAIIARMLAKRPADRFQTPREVSQALAPLAGPVSLPGKLPRKRKGDSTLDDIHEVTNREIVAPQPARGSSRKILVAVGVVAVLGIALASLLFLPSRSGKTGESSPASVAVSKSQSGGTAKVAATVATEPAGPRLLFSDDFEDGGGKWKVTSGKYQVVAMDGSQRYRLIHKGNDKVPRSTAGESSWTDYTIQAKLRVGDLEDGGSASLLARYQDTYRWYGLGYTKQHGAWRIFIRRDNGEGQLGMGPAFRFDPNRYYALKVELKGPVLKLYVDDVLQVTATDSTYPRGKIGFHAWKTTAYLDDVSVTAP